MGLYFNISTSMAQAILGTSPLGRILFYVFQLSTALILAVAANTGFSAFPMLSYNMAKNKYMPHMYMEKGDRLSYSNGIFTLAFGAIALLCIFEGNTERLIPEIDGDMGDSHMGLQARLMSQSLRKLTGIINKSKATVIFINQIRMKIGVMFGNPETTTGGNALKFYASQRVDIRRIGQIKVGDDILGNRTKINVVKNKIAPPFRIAEFDIMLAARGKNERGVCRHVLITIF